MTEPALQFAAGRGTRTLVAGLALGIVSCHPYATEPIANRIAFSPRLSDYALFHGAMANLTPGASVHAFALNTPLFSDYSLKQRLLKLPPGTVITGTGSGLPSFPDGTVLAKTFYYDRDLRRPSLGKRIIETRVLIRHDGRWNASTYRWNDAQDDAMLISNGATVPVEWADSSGVRRTVAYEIPSVADCSTCHGSAGVLTPIGPKLRNLRVPAARLTEPDQLERFSRDGLLNHADVSGVARLPRWDDIESSWNSRARAYLDVNCAHCHTPSGQAGASGLLLEFERPVDGTRINSRRDQIMRRLTSTNRAQRMPRIGTTVRHDEGVALIREYLSRR